MVRLLTDKVSPDVICESSFEYELPADWGDMLNGFDDVDEEYRQSILSGIHYTYKKVCKSGFFAQELISP